MAVEGQEQKRRQDRQELPQRRAGLPALRVHARRKPQSHDIGDGLTRDQRRGEADLDGKAEREADQHLSCDKQKTGDGDEPVGRKGEGRCCERRDADGKRNHQPELNGNEGGAENRRRQESCSGPDHRDHPQPELRF